jgi:NAD(P)-dependent dehydrogenase (short-subunit alcohol dehydrogenase family)
MSKGRALVTGANRGLGLETCRQLGHLGYEVTLTARNDASGEQAAKRLQDEGILAHFHHLDVTSADSIDVLRQDIEQAGGLDVLVNNAGIFERAETVPDCRHSSFFDVRPDEIRHVLEVNLMGPVMLCQALAPLIHANGRIVNVSSGMGQLSDMGGHYPGYRLSKTALNALTRILADELRGSNIKVNALCPGWVQTDMGGKSAHRSIAEGADTIVWLADLPTDGPTGGFFRDRTPLPW